MAKASTFELNDTLQITKAQGFPEFLDIKNHLQNPYSINKLEGRVFEFKNKEGLRNFVVPPVRCFLVENINGKWLYWGHCHIQELKLDYINKTTSGKYKIIKIFSPEEVKNAFTIVDGNKETDYFKNIC